MVSYLIEYHRNAVKEIQKLKLTGLDGKAKQLIDVLRENPFQSPPQFEKLSGDLVGLYSRRINIQHRLVYEVIKDENTVRILSMWSHYE